MRQTISVLDAQCPWQDAPTVFPLSLPEYAGLRQPIQQVDVRALAFFVVHFSSEMDVTRRPFFLLQLCGGGPAPADPTARPMRPRVSCGSSPALAGPTAALVSAGLTPTPSMVNF